MDDGEIQNIGVSKKILKEAEEKIHYGCLPSQGQMFEILVCFCKDYPNEFTEWKKNKLEQLKKQWQKKKPKKKKLKK